MTYREVLKHELETSKEFFERSARVLQEEHSGYAPTPDQYTVAAQVAHAALTIDWFLEGAFGKGWDFDFEGHDHQARAVTSLAAARQMLDSAYGRAMAATAEKSEAEWLTLFAADSLMQGPKATIVFGIVEHSAHHRGALTVYSRMLGVKPLMPYMEMPA
jgi:uncharacterized damage-inducible protein DinB